MPVRDTIDQLAREPLRNVVLLKHLLAHPQDVTVHQISGPNGASTLVALDVSVSDYDRQTYPKAAVAAFIASDHPDLTASLISRIPRGVGIVFKLSCETDLAPIAAQFPVTRRTAFISFTSTDRFEPDPGVHITSTPSDMALALFETQGHDCVWLERLLLAGKAFACVLEREGRTLSACFAFENFASIWEVGGLVTPPSDRRQGFGARVVRTALNELDTRGLVPRYQVEEQNIASINLARSVGLVPFLTITHYEYTC